MRRGPPAVNPCSGSNNVENTGLDSGACTSVKSWPGSVDGPGFSSAYAPVNSWSGLDCPVCASPSINSYPDSCQRPYSCPTLVEIALEELNPRLKLATPLIQHSYRVLGYVRGINACLTFLSYWRRRRDSEVDNGMEARHYCTR